MKKYRVNVNGVAYEVELEEITGAAPATVPAAPAPAAAPAGGESITSPMPGNILSVNVSAGDTVKKLVEGFINPVVQFVVGSQSALANAEWKFELFGREADFKWGAFVSSLITLLATALVIYFIIHGLKLDKLDKKKS